MAITFEFIMHKDFHIAEEFGKRFDMPVAENRVYLPNSLGDGYIQEIKLRESLSLSMARFTLKKDFLVKRLESGGPSRC